MRATAVDYQEFIELAQCAPTQVDYETQVLERLHRAVGCDTVMFARQGRPGEVCFGGDIIPLKRLAERFPIYTAESMGPRARLIAHAGGIASESELFPNLDSTHFYQELLRPSKAGKLLFGVLSWRGQSIGLVTFSRSCGSFGEAQRTTLRAALPTLSMCELALRSTARIPHPSIAWALSAREREVLDFLRLGSTNREIAAALGTSPRTVRNQLVSIFRKLGASTRAEAVAMSLSP